MMADNVTKTWEAYGNKDVIFYQHLEPFDKAQEKLSQLIAQETTNSPAKDRIQTTTEFLTNFFKTILKVRIKMEKYTHLKTDIAFTKTLDWVIKTITDGDYQKIELIEYAHILFNVGLIYERLGYSSPERERIRTNMQSDMELPGTDTPEYMENIPTNVIDYLKSEANEDK